MRLSVALCTYNGEKYIVEQLESILNQSVKLNEIIICDDNSKDQTLELIQNVLNKAPYPITYRIIKNETSLGVATNFLKALKYTTGDYVFLSDQDDVWKEDKVQVFLKYIEQEKPLALFSDGWLVNEKKIRLQGTLWSTIDFCPEMLDGKSMFELMLNRSIVTGAAMAVSKKLIDRIDYIPEGWLHDNWLGIIAASCESIIPIPQKLFEYRQHGNNVVGATKRSFFEKFKDYIKNCRKLKQERNERYEKYMALKSIGIEKYDEKIAECIYFWKSLSDIETETKIKKVSTVFKLQKKGYYKKYYTGMRGAFRDMILTIFE